MSDYKLTVRHQWWRHLTAANLSWYVQKLADLGLIFNVEREAEPEPKPEVKIIHAPPEVRIIYPCLHKGCDYETTSLGGLKTHQRVHK